MSYRSTLNSLSETGNYRRIPQPIPIGKPQLAVDLSSNDYLGIAARKDLQQEFFDSFGNNIPAMTSSASRLLAQDQDAYFQLESLLSALYGSRPCLLFNSGYHANTGLLSAFASEPKTIIIADKLVHASMIDGMILSRAPFRRFAHNDFSQLETLLQRIETEFDRIIVAVESVYSMDGDRADIEALIRIKRRHPKTILYVDEAHAFGVCGAKGLGLCLDSSAREEIDVIVGTFGKAAASMGAFAILSNEMREYAVNRSRSLIFSTALPPLTCAWTSFVIGQMTGMNKEREYLQHISTEVFNCISRIAPSAGPSEPSHITPFLIGDPVATVELSNRLLKEGFKVLPIRTPTVPAGKERLRISLSASIPEHSITEFCNALERIL